jgi:hypothetical protein
MHLLTKNEYIKRQKLIAKSFFCNNGTIGEGLSLVQLTTGSVVLRSLQMMSMRCS